MDQFRFHLFYLHRYINAPSHSDSVARANTICAFFKVGRSENTDLVMTCDSILGLFSQPFYSLFLSSALLRTGCLLGTLPSTGTAVVVAASEAD